MGSLQNPSTPVLQFNTSDVPLEPTDLRQGDSWNWERTFGDYTSKLYKLTYILNSAKNLFKFPDTAITASDDGEGFVIQVTAAQSASCTPDKYQILAVLTGIAETKAASQQVTIPLQDVIVAPNMAQATTPVDTRSFVKKTLDMIEAAIGGIQDVSVQEYMINGRQLRRFSLKELTEQRATYKNLYKAELRASGQYAPTRKIGFRFKNSY